MNKKLITCLFLLFFSTKVVFCGERFLPGGQKPLSRSGRLERRKRKAEELNEKTQTKKLRVEDLSLLEQQEKDKRFWQAIENRSFDAIESILNAKGNPNIRTEEGVTPLLNFATDVYGALLCKSPSYNQKLHEGSLNFNSRVMEILLQHDADPNIKNSFNETSLHKAMIMGDSSMVLELLEHDQTLW